MFPMFPQVLPPCAPLMSNPVSLSSPCMSLLCPSCSLYLFLVPRRVTLMVAFAFLTQNFGKVMGTYQWYFVSVFVQFEQYNHWWWRHSNQWRIQDFPEGVPTPNVGVLTYVFSRKLNKNERIWTPKGGLPLQTQIAVNKFELFGLTDIFLALRRATW